MFKTLIGREDDDFMRNQLTACLVNTVSGERFRLKFRESRINDEEKLAADLFNAFTFIIKRRYPMANLLTELDSIRLSRG